jgi:hypothetical protein
MSETLTQTETHVQPTEPVQPQDNSAAIASAVWGETTPVQEEKKDTPPVESTQPAAEATTTTPAEEILDEDVFLDSYFKKEFGIDAAAAKSEWEALRKLKETPPAQQEPQWANEESKKIYELVKEGKREELRRALNEQAELDRLEKYDITDANQAAEIIKANLQFKYKDLDPKQIDRLYSRQYALPEKPDLDESDPDYEQEMAQWQRQVQEKEMDIMIDAKIAQPELANYKKQIVFPDIPKANEPAGQQGPSQEDLAAQQAFRNDFIQKLGTEYRNFQGYNAIAKDGEVELPISYSLNDDEKLAFNATVQEAVDDIQGFLDNKLGWWNDETKSFNINKMQADLYLLLNRDKVFSKFAGEAAAQRFQHHLKTSNNINLKGVSPQLDIPAGQVLDEKAKNQKVAETIWSY